MKIGIVGNATCLAHKEIFELLKSCNQIIAADGGANLCFQMDLVPNLIIGDGDSILESTQEHFENLNVTFETHETDKNFTDLELAFRRAESFSPSEILVAFWADERVDYTWDFLATIEDTSTKVRLLGAQFDAYVLNPHQPEIQAPKLKNGHRVSVFPIRQPVNLKSEGLRWELNWTAEQSKPKSQSNEILTDSARISLSEGSALVLIEKASARKSVENS